MVSYFFLGTGAFRLFVRRDVIDMHTKSMVQVSTPPYGAAKIRYVTAVPYTVAVPCGTVPCGTIRYYF